MSTKSSQPQTSRRVGSVVGFPPFPPSLEICRSKPSLAFATLCRHTKAVTDLQAVYDDAMFDYSTGDYASALAKLRAILAEDTGHFDAQLAIAMCHYRQGDFATAIAEGHKAEVMRPNEQLVHTNLSLFYMKSGDKKTAEHHGLQARIASWKQDMTAPGTKPKARRRTALGTANGAAEAAGLQTAREVSRHAVEEEGGRARWHPRHRIRRARLRPIPIDS